MIPHCGHIAELADSDETNQRNAGRIVTERVKTNLGQMLDVSTTGMRLYSPFFAPSQSKILEMIVSGPDGKFTLVGRVVWVRKLGLFAREFGFEFYGLDEHAREGIATIARFSMQIEMSEHRRAA